MTAIHAMTSVAELPDTHLSSAELLLARQAATQTSQGLTDAQRSALIRQRIMAESDRLRAAHPWLLKQDRIGASLLAVSLAGMLLNAWSYAQGWQPAWVTVLVAAFCASITHEIEHDLIHWMYFRKLPWAHHLMMALVWLARPSTINPWVRRQLHLDHHKFSGTVKDMEERAITNGVAWGPRRLLMVGDNALSLILRMIWTPKSALTKRMLSPGFTTYSPLTTLHWTSWHAFLLLHAGNLIANLQGHASPWPQSIQSLLPALDFAVVVWFGPNVLRTFCLHFVGSNMHYFGDVEEGNLMQQCQVLTPWWMAPMQLFCFNFGSTHAIHHFVVRDPFYLRQMTAPVAHRVMREMGVRFNDVGTFWRANRRMA